MKSRYVTKILHQTLLIRSITCLHFKKTYDKNTIFDFNVSFNTGINFIVDKTVLGKLLLSNLLMGTMKAREKFL